MPSIMKSMTDNIINSTRVSTSNSYNLLAILLIIFVIICGIIIKYPSSALGHIFNSILGKVIIIFLIILLTSHNTLVGLVATVMIIGVYSHFQKKTHEGFTAIPPYTPLSRPSLEKNIIPDAYGKEKNNNHSYTPETQGLIKNDITTASGTSAIEVEKSKDKKKPIVVASSEMTENMRKNTRVDRVNTEHSIRSKSSNTLPQPHFKVKNEPVSNWPDKKGFSALNSGIDEYYN